MTRRGHTPARTCRFVHDEAGSVLVLWIMSLVAVLAFVALVFDMGRVQVTHGELQSFADSVALAAAGELDGGPNAIARATAAAAEVADTNVYGGDGTLSGPNDYTLTFLTDLPADDTADPSGFVLSTPYGASDDAAARMVRVSVTPVSLGVSFLAATNALTGAGGGATMSMRAEAIAGFTQEACDIAPMMICLPPGWSADDHKGEMIEMRAGGNGADWTPGEFGFLQQNLLNTGGPCADLSGSQQDLCYLAAAGPVTKCFAKTGVDFKTGQSQGNFAAAVSTRFDVYESTMNGVEGDALFAPALNRISGIAVTRSTPGNSGNINCSYTTSPDSVGLPPDTCFDTDTCGGYDGRFRDGVWDLKKYFGVNYLHMDQYVLDGDGNPTDTETDFSGVTYGEIDAALPAAMAQWLSANALTTATATRFDVYRAENAISGEILSGLAETGRPACNLTSNPLVDEYRRTIIAAGVVCTDSSGNSLYQGSASGVPVEEFVRLFLTKPAVSDGGGSDKFSIWAEVVGSEGKSGYGGAGSGGIFRDVVQLYW